MSYPPGSDLPPPSRELSRQFAIVGLGETDYRLDYQAARQAAKNRDRTYQPPTPEGLASIAFERALADSGLSRKDIDGLSLSFLYGGPDVKTTADYLGLQPRHLMEGTGIMAGALPAACAAIAEGKCDTIALVYAVATRAQGRKFGGQMYGDNGAPTSYYYYHPWGWSSQAAHWALAWQHYRATYGASEEDLGAVAIQLRQNAMATPHAVMHRPLTMDDYLASRYVVWPLHLYDLCLVNDGGVCLILRRLDRCNDLPRTPVLLAGWGEAKVRQDKLQALVRERLGQQFQEAGRQALDMAGLTTADIQHFECYDAATSHLINHLEGHGFAPPGQGCEFCKSGEMAIDGSLPVNTAGGMLSGAYMHGWNHVAEITRQLRHEAGERQVKDVEVSMFSMAQTDQVHPLVFTRGDTP